ncbi:MAG: 7-cyano-7-deazaguanine synthase [Acidobacteria bacterium]|nr:7-cyano-7-deazaguanine synthase [Acidobacteriota bacterium]
MVVKGSNDGQGGVTAVLCSGGLDSAVLVAYEAQSGAVQPVYVSGGLAWEQAEEARVARLLAASAYGAGVNPLVRVEQPVTDVYAPTHWAVRGTPPAYNTPDSDVYLVGRNVLLLSKSAVYCALHGISKIAVGPLAGNPFPDATPEFFAALGHALSLGLDHAIEVTAPFAQLDKPDVIRIGAELGVPWELTLSCMNPAGVEHCGRCSKCRERLQAFDAAGVEDPAPYAWRPENVTTGQ